MFDKKDIFSSQIEEKLLEVGRLCNRYRIPFVWVAAVADDGEKTEYGTVIETGKTESSPSVEYVCDGVTPGAMEIALTDDRIKEVIKVVNGFKAVPQNSGAVISQDGFIADGFVPKRLSSLMSEGLPPLSSTADDDDNVPYGDFGDFFSNGYIPEDKDGNSGEGKAAPVPENSKKSSLSPMPPTFESEENIRFEEKLKSANVCYEGEIEIDL